MVLSKHQFDKSFPPQYTHRYTGLLPRCHQQHGGIFYIVVLCSSVGRLQAGTRLSDGRGVIIRPTGNQANRERPLMSRSLPVDGRPSVCLSRLVVPRQDRRSTRSRSATERETGRGSGRLSSQQAAAERIARRLLCLPQHSAVSCLHAHCYQCGDVTETRHSLYMIHSLQQNAN